MKDNKKTRDQYLCDDYKDGMSIGELSRAYGLTERRIGQILLENGISRRPRTPGEKTPLSSGHVRLGLHLYSHRFDRGIELKDAANDLGWSTLILRKVEKGTTKVELLDLMDIAAYTETNMAELVEKIYGH